MKDDTVRLRHLRDSIQKIEQFLDGISYEKFITDEKTVSAVLHELMVLGEASAAISQELRDAHNEIPFHEMIGMRNRIVHEYLDVRLETVWKTCREDLPELKKALEDII